MEAIEFLATDKNGKECTIFINPEYIESISMYAKVENKTKISLVSGNSVMVNYSLKEVKEKLLIDKEKRPVRRFLV